MAACEPIVTTLDSCEIPTKFHRDYKEKPTRCFKCQEYGHKAKNCQRKPRCQRCGNEHSTADCPQDPTLEVPRCLHCSGEHPTGDKKCAKYQRECKVVNIQTKQRISYSEAVKTVQANHRTDKVNNTNEETTINKEAASNTTHKDNRQAADQAVEETIN